MNLIPSTMDVVEPKAKNKYNTKKEKDNDASVEKLISLGQTMVGDELHDEEAQSIKNMVEEATKAPPHKSKKKHYTKMSNP